MITTYRDKDELTDPQLAGCVCGPLATRRKRMAVACRCAERATGFGLDRRLRHLLDLGTRYATRAAGLRDVEAALRSADAVDAEARRRSAGSVWSLFDGRRVGEALADARTARGVTSAVRWALGLPGGSCPPVPATWFGVRRALTAFATAPAFDPLWRTGDVLALARLVRDGGVTDALPILADALQDAGCEHAAILDHCRGPEPHATECWVPDLILDTE